MKRIILWLKRKLTFSQREDYKPFFVACIPKKVEKHQVYIVVDGNVPDTIVFKCPCGCEADVYLNLLADTRPRWNFHIENGKLSILPSIRRKVGCKSHFYLSTGKVKWC